MKKLFSLFIIITLLLSFSACSKDDEPVVNDLMVQESDDKQQIADTDSYYIEPKYACADVTSEITVVKHDPINAIVQNNTYIFKNDDSKALLELLNSLTYDESRCACLPEHTLYLNGAELSTFGIKLDESEAYVTYDNNQKKLSKDQETFIRQIFNSNLTRENYIPLEEGSTAVTLCLKTGEKYDEYTFKNEDSKRLLILLGDLQFTDLTKADKDTADVKIKLQNSNTPRYAFCASDKTLMTYNKKATITDANVNELQQIISRNCVQENRSSYENYQKDVYVTYNGDQYVFKNADSETLLNNLHNYVYNFDSSTEYTNGLKIHYKTDAYSVKRFYIDIEDFGAYISNYSSGYVNVEVEQAQQLLELVKRNCTEQTLITDPKKLSDM